MTVCGGSSETDLLETTLIATTSNHIRERSKRKDKG